jgi:hypothetical protein
MRITVDIDGGEMEAEGCPHFKTLFINLPAGKEENKENLKQVRCYKLK